MHHENSDPCCDVTPTSESLVHFQWYQQSMSVPPSHTRTHQLQAQYHLCHHDQGKTKASHFWNKSDQTVWGRELSQVPPNYDAISLEGVRRTHQQSISHFPISAFPKDLTVGTCQLLTSVTPGNNSRRNQTFNRSRSLWTKCKRRRHCRYQSPGIRAGALELSWACHFTSLGYTIPGTLGQKWNELQRQLCQLSDFIGEEIQPQST